MSQPLESLDGLNAKEESVTPQPGQLDPELRQEMSAEGVQNLERVRGTDATALASDLQEQDHLGSIPSEDFVSSPPSTELKKPGTVEEEVKVKETRKGLQRDYGEILEEATFRQLPSEFDQERTIVSLADTLGRSHQVLFDSLRNKSDISKSDYGLILSKSKHPKSKFGRWRFLMGRSMSVKHGSPLLNALTFPVNMIRQWGRAKKANGTEISQKINKFGSEYLKFRERYGRFFEQSVQSSSKPSKAARLMAKGAEILKKPAKALKAIYTYLFGRRKEAFNEAKAKVESLAKLFQEESIPQSLRDKSTQLLKAFVNLERTDQPDAKAKFVEAYQDYDHELGMFMAIMEERVGGVIEAAQDAVGKAYKTGQADQFQSQATLNQSAPSQSTAHFKDLYDQTKTIYHDLSSTLLSGIDLSEHPEYVSDIRDNILSDYDLNTMDVSQLKGRTVEIEASLEKISTETSDEAAIIRTALTGISAQYQSVLSDKMLVARHAGMVEADGGEMHRTEARDLAFTGPDGEVTTPVETVPLEVARQIAEDEAPTVMDRVSNVAGQVSDAVASVKRSVIGRDRSADTFLPQFNISLGIGTDRVTGSYNYLKLDSSRGEGDMAQKSKTPLLFRVKPNRNGLALSYLEDNETKSVVLVPPQRLKDRGLSGEGSVGPLHDELDRLFPGGILRSTIRDFIKSRSEESVGKTSQSYQNYEAFYTVMYNQLTASSELGEIAPSGAKARRSGESILTKADKLLDRATEAVFEIKHINDHFDTSFMVEAAHNPSEFSGHLIALRGQARSTGYDFKVYAQEGGGYKLHYSKEGSSSTKEAVLPSYDVIKDISDRKQLKHILNTNPKELMKLVLAKISNKKGEVDDAESVKQMKKNYGLLLGYLKAYAPVTAAKDTMAATGVFEAKSIQYTKRADATSPVEGQLSFYVGDRAVITEVDLSDVKVKRGVMGKSKSKVTVVENGNLLSFESVAQGREITETPKLRFIANETDEAQFSRQFRFGAHDSVKGSKTEGLFRFSYHQAGAHRVGKSSGHHEIYLNRVGDISEDSDLSDITIEYKRASHDGRKQFVLPNPSKLATYDAKAMRAFQKSLPNRIKSMPPFSEKGEIDPTQYKLFFQMMQIMETPETIFEGQFAIKLFKDGDQYVYLPSVADIQHSPDRVDEFLADLSREVGEPVMNREVLSRLYVLTQRDDYLSLMHEDLELSQAAEAVLESPVTGEGTVAEATAVETPPIEAKDVSASKPASKKEIQAMAKRLKMSIAQFEKQLSAQKAQFEVVKKLGMTEDQLTDIEALLQEEDGRFNQMLKQLYKLQDRFSLKKGITDKTLISANNQIQISEFDIIDLGKELNCLIEKHQLFSPLYRAILTSIGSMGLQGQFKSLDIMDECFELVYQESFNEISDPEDIRNSIAQLQQRYTPLKESALATYEKVVPAIERRELITPEEILEQYKSSFQLIGKIQNSHNISKEEWADLSSKLNAVSEYLHHHHIAEASGLDEAIESVSQMLQFDDGSDNMVFTGPQLGMFKMLGQQAQLVEYPMALEVMHQWHQENAESYMRDIDALNMFMKENEQVFSNMVSFSKFIKDTQDTMALLNIPESDFFKINIHCEKDAFDQQLKAKKDSFDQLLQEKAIADAAVVTEAEQSAPRVEEPIADVPVSDVPVSDVPVSDAPVEDAPVAPDKDADYFQSAFRSFKDRQFSGKKTDQIMTLIPTLSDVEREGSLLILQALHDTPGFETLKGTKKGDKYYTNIVKLMSKLEEAPVDVTLDKDADYFQSAFRSFKDRQFKGNTTNKIIKQIPKLSVEDKESALLVLNTMKETPGFEALQGTKKGGKYYDNIVTLIAKLSV